MPVDWPCPKTNVPWRADAENRIVWSTLRECEPPTVPAERHQRSVPSLLRLNSERSEFFRLLCSSRNLDRVSADAMHVGPVERHAHLSLVACCLGLVL